MFRFLIVLCVFNYQILFGQDTYTFQTFDKIIDAEGNTVLELQVGVKTADKGYDGRAKWKVINSSDKDLFQISIMERKYTLKNGKIKKLHAIKLFNDLSSGSEKTSITDNINQIENTGFWSDINKNPPSKIEVAEPIIIFYLKPNGREISWAEGKELVIRRDFTKQSVAEAYEFLFPHKPLKKDEINQKDIEVLDRILKDLVLRSCQMSYAESLKSTAVNPNKSMLSLLMAISKKGIEGCDFKDDYRNIKIYKSIVDKVRLAYKSSYEIRLNQGEW